MRIILKAMITMLFCVFIFLLSTSCSKEEEMGNGGISGGGTVGYASKSATQQSVVKKNGAEAYSSVNKE